MSGPGAMASPAWRADQPHTPCSQSTIDRSIAPKEAEKKIATNDAPVNPRDLNSDRVDERFVARTTVEHEQTDEQHGPGQRPDNGGGCPSPAATLDEPESEGPYARCSEDGPDGIRLFHRVTRYVWQPSPTDD